MSACLHLICPVLSCQICSNLCFVLLCSVLCHGCWGAVFLGAAVVCVFMCPVDGSGCCRLVCCRVTVCHTGCGPDQSLRMAFTGVVSAIHVDIVCMLWVLLPLCYNVVLGEYLLPVYSTSGLCALCPVPCCCTWQAAGCLQYMVYYQMVLHCSLVTFGLYMKCTFAVRP